MKMICMAVMLFITLLSAGAQKNIPASDIKVAMMKATRFMVEKVSNRGGYLWNYKLPKTCDDSFEWTPPYDFVTDADSVHAIHCLPGCRRLLQ
jgi:hypothetical protein